MSDKEETEFGRRDDDKIPSAYKLWMQTALNHMQTPPQMLEDIRRTISEVNEGLVHKINNNIQAKFGEIQIDFHEYKTEQAIIKGEHDSRIKAIESASSTIRWIIGLLVIVVVGSFTLISIFAQ